MKQDTIGQQLAATESNKEKNTELSNSPNFAVERGNNEDYGNKILDRITIVGTPFTIVRTEENLEKSFIAIGNNRITELTTEIELTEKLENKDWDLITSLVIIITERVMAGIKEEDQARYETINDKYKKEEEKK